MFFVLFHVWRIWTQEGALPSPTDTAGSVAMCVFCFLMAGTVRKRPVVVSTLLQLSSFISTQVDRIWMLVHFSKCLKSESVPAWAASAINYFFSSRKEGQQLASAPCPGLTVSLFSSPQIYSLMCILFLLSLFLAKKKENTKRRKPVWNRRPHKWLDCVPLMA